MQRKLVSYHEHNEAARAEELLRLLQEGQRVALVSDAGMPGISDPGQRLVAAAVAGGIRVTPIPGPVAAIVALAASGLPTDRYVFEGFLPRQGRDRARRLAAIAAEERTIVIYEAPHRLARTLADLTAALGERPAVLARELTKRYEEFTRGTLPELAAGCAERTPRGEYVVVVAGRPAAAKAAPPPPVAADTVETMLAAALAAGTPLPVAAKEVALRLHMPRRAVYQAGLRLQLADEPEDQGGQAGGDQRAGRDTAEEEDTQH